MMWACPRPMTCQVPSSIPTSAVFSSTPGTLFNPGDTLIWTPPTGAHNISYNAFPLTAQDGTLAASLSTRFRVTIA